jgi:hypothetical protein
MIATLPPAPFLQALVRLGTSKERVVERRKRKSALL